MIVYSSNKAQFLEDVFSNNIDGIILEKFKYRMGKSVSSSEVNSWKNSLTYMYKILNDEEIPEDSGVAIEYNVPQTSKRIDFILTGQDSTKRDHAIIIELKQWTEAKSTNKDGIVKTYLGGGEVETNHPSYQAWSYAALLEDFNETVRDDNIALTPCAYLHNCTSYDDINHKFYQPHLDKAPIFLKSDAAKLQDFIKRFVRHGDSKDIIFRIDNGKIRPSKSLADSLASLLSGNQEFLMIDDQKIVYEFALDLAVKAGAANKCVMIVEGGPGTGKSVVAINLLVELIQRGFLAQYVTKNAAPRSVYESKLAGTLTKTRIGNLFRGSGAFTDCESNIFDVLIVDEAHRLNAKSGMFQNLGENQIKEILNASKLSIFFIDEDQRVTFKDIGRKEDIEFWAETLGVTTHNLQLESQFRCNGSDGYLSWLDSTLQIRQTANNNLDNVDYDYRVCSSPNELKELITEKNLINNKARMVAGYCWEWKSKKDYTAADIEIEGYDFGMQWNLQSDGSLWILKPESVKEIGCIHTCQGLEVDYVGVIIGPDLIIREGTVIAVPEARAKSDSSIRGYKKLLKENPEAAKEKVDAIIKNTYRTLMTRGKKGCYIFCTDPETNSYFKQFEISSSSNRERVDSKYPNLSLRVLPYEEVKPYENSVPLYDLKIAAGHFSDYQNIEDCDWVELNDPFVPKEGLFIVRVIGESMNKHIPNGSWCLFKANPEGTRQGKVVLVQHRDIQDPDTGGQYTVKTYSSYKKELDAGSWEHSKIVLKPQTTHFGYKDIILEGESAVELRVLGELVAVLS